MGYPLEPIFHNYLPDLSYLIRLCVTSVTLDIHPLKDTLFPEIVMTSLHPLSKPQSQQKQTKIVEADIRVGAATQYPLSQPIFTVCHGLMLRLKVLGKLTSI